MCGFGGIINSIEPLHPQELGEIASRVNHRGPDSCGIRILDESLTNNSIGLHAIFFNRLAIVDLDKRSNQPFEDEDHLLVFNGEIYNYTELKKELAQVNINFHTTSDTEVLFYALKVWGLAALPKLNGMFSFFWLDKKQRNFIVARDRVGIKPLYYSKQNKTFYFSSELYSILRFMRAKPAISSAAVDMYMWMQFVPTPYSIFEGIYKLPPGSYLRGNLDAVEDLVPTAYWDAYKFIETAKPIKNSNFENILKESVEKQLHADVPLGLFLSSGVDSSLLAAIVNKYFSGGQPVNFFTVQFEENTASDESQDASEFIKGFNNPSLHCNTININPDTVRDHLESLYDYYDEPFADMASLLNWMISKKAREFVTVAISGDGADEMFWGYDRYQRWKKFEEINSIPILPGIVKTIAELLPGTVQENTKFVLEKDPVKRHFNFFLPSGMRFKINNPIVRYPMWALEGIDKLKHREDLSAILDIKTYLADGMLYKVDRSSMASSLEVRVPYLDNNVIEYALSMPLSEKSTPEYKSKAPLKKLLMELAPHYNMRKTKKGFNFPLREWMKVNWKELVLSTVNHKVLQDAGLDPKPYMKIVDDFYAGRNDHFTDVWYILNLALWMKKTKSIERY